METKDYGNGIFLQVNQNGTLAIVWNNSENKKFRGETAWMDAERYANDLVFKVMYA
jgi:hypothetical protein